MKLRFKISSDHFRKLSANPNGVMLWIAFLLVCAYVLFLGSRLYTTVYLSIIVPKPVDQQQINARQEKINRQQLNSAKTFNDAKQSSTVPAGGKSPF